MLVRQIIQRATQFRLVGFLIFVILSGLFVWSGIKAQTVEIKQLVSINSQKFGDVNPMMGKGFFIRNTFSPANSEISGSDKTISINQPEKAVNNIYVNEIDADSNVTSLENFLPQLINTSLSLTFNKPLREEYGKIGFSEVPISPSPADPYTNLVESNASIPYENRTPVILIHGIHGNKWPKAENSSEPDEPSIPYPNYFSKLIASLEKDPQFNAAYKIYRFHYKSDVKSIYDIAASLRNRIDNRVELQPKQIILIAHSMGGLVARSYMNQHNTDAGPYIGTPAGQRVIKLITLATPHHGTPLVNGTARLNLNLDFQTLVNWSTALSNLDLGFWSVDAGCLDCVSNLQHSNRGDLLWDNFDGLWNNNQSYIGNVNEQNNSLRSIGHNYDYKIVAYWGTIGSNTDTNSLWGKGPKALRNRLLYRGLKDYQDAALNVLGVLNQRILTRNYTTYIPLNVNNDGMVPASSAKFDRPPGANWPDVSDRIYCSGYNHRAMRDGGTLPCSDGKKLLDSIKSQFPFNPQPTRIITVNSSGNFGYATVQGNRSLSESATSALVDDRVQLQNLGDTSVQVTSLNITGTDANQFSIINPPSLPFSISPNGIVEVTVRFQPTSQGIKTAILTANNNSNLSTSFEGLEGTGILSSCDITLGSEEAYIAPDGGVGSFSVPATNCSWTVSSDYYWIHASRNGQTIEYSVERNPSGIPRTGQIKIQIDNRYFTFSIYQQSTPTGCPLSLSENMNNPPASGGNFNFIASTPANCGWSVSTDSNWITVTTTGVRVGTQPVNFTVAPNQGNSLRTGTIKVLGQDFIQTYTVVQNSNSGSNCNYLLSSSEQLFPNNGGSNGFTLTTSSNCQWQVNSPDQWIAITSANNGVGTRTINYTVTANPYTSQRVGSINIQGAGTNLFFTVRESGQPVFYPDINLPATSADTGNALINTSIYQSFVIQNTGPGYLSIGSIYRSSGSTEFELLPYSNLVQSGESATVTVKFTPASTGIKSAAFSITSNDPDENPVNFTISGTGVTQLTGGSDFIWTNRFNVPAQASIDYVTSATINNNIYVVGGNDYKYDPTINSWSQIAQQPFAQYGAADVINGKIYLVGYDPFSVTTRVVIYDPTNNSWSTGATMPTLRLDVAVAAANGRIYVFGGRNGTDGNAQPTSDVYEYNPANNTWAVKNAMPTARMGAAAISLNGLIYVIGGMTTSSVLHTVEVYNPANNTWTMRESMPSSRAYTSAFTINSKIYVAGGNGFAYGGGSVRRDLVEEFDPSKADAPSGSFNAWSVRNPLIIGRFACASGVVNNKAYIIGGSDASGAGVYTVEEGALSAAPRFNMPVRSIDYGSVSLGSIGEKGIELQNLGNALLTINSINRISGSSDFTIYRYPPNMNGGDSTNFRMRFTPSGTGMKTAAYRITTNDPNSPTVDFTVTAAGQTASPIGGNWQLIRSFSLQDARSAGDIKIKNGKAYVTRFTNSSDIGLDVLDVNTGNRLANIPVNGVQGAFPNRVEVNGNRAYVTLRNISPGKLAVINLDDNTVPAYVSVGSEPNGVASNGSEIFVSNSLVFSNGNPSPVKIVNASDYSVSSVNVGVNPIQTLYDTNTAKIYVANEGDPTGNELKSNDPNKSLSIIDPATNTVSATIPLQYRPVGIAITGNKAYVSTLSTVEVIDLSSNTIVSSIPVPEYAFNIVAVNGYIFLTNDIQGRVTVIKTDTSEIVGSLNIGNSNGNAVGISVDSDTGIVYVLNSATRTVSVYRFIAPTFFVTTNNQTLASPQGGNTTVTASVASIDGWTGPVTLSCEGLPTGGTCQFAQNPVNLPANGTGSTNVTINVPAGTVPGPYGFRVVGNGTGTGLLFTEPQTDYNNLALTVPTCEYQLSATQPINIGAAGGSGNINVSGTSGCGWTAASDAGWLRVTSGSSGNGNGTVNYTVDPNTGQPRSATLTIAGQTITVNQASGCTYTLNSSNQNIGSAGGPGSFTVSAIGGCTWDAATTDSWITITSGTPGNGNGTVNFTVAANTGSIRSGTILAAGQSFTINQASGCSFSLSSSSINIGVSGGSGSFNVNSGAGCPWTANSNDTWITITSGGTGTGSGIVAFSVQSSVNSSRTGTITAAGQTFTINQSSTTRTPFDFDGDGKTDIAIFRPSVAEWWYQKSSNGQVAAAQFGALTDNITPGDWTGDGKTDISVWRPSTGEWFVLRSEDFSFYSFPFGTSGDIPAPADYDGDGKTDAAVFRPSNSTWFISRSGGGITIQQFGASSDKPVVADYDGDGKSDIAIFRPNVAEWWYQKSSNGQVAAAQFGTSTDKPVQGDYTGDGKADIAFYRPSTGFWFILRSEDFSFYSFPFGANGDIPAPGDYDGDGKFDATVFRPSTVTWYVNKSTGGNLIQTFGGAGDRPVPNAFVP